MPRSLDRITGLLDLNWIGRELGLDLGLNLDFLEELDLRIMWIIFRIWMDKEMSRCDELIGWCGDVGFG